MLGVVYPATACQSRSSQGVDLFQDSQVLSREAVLSGLSYAALATLVLSLGGAARGLGRRSCPLFDLERWGYPRSSATMQKPRW